ncbi:MAG TPA: zinc metalloprotease HtpX [Candidatus Limnocylindrales bacterium]|nr:zinc metalloprotease HtpX [Candidatus Limnocylindrales bacterium]
MIRTTFYDQEATNRRESVLLVLVVLAILALFGFAIGYGTSGYLESGIAVTLGALVLGALVSVGSYFGGDQLVLASSGAKEVDPQSAPQLMNVVQEMALAAGVPMPKVYVIEDSAPNAFATGRDPNHASVAITTGLLQKLDREELQGVLGHELSHVRNFDIRFGLLVAVLVGSIALLADMFLRFTWFGGGRSRNDRNGGGAAAIVFVLAIVLAVLAPIFARLVQLAVSRQREYLADASSVELTRNPHGIERALAKIAADQDVLEVANRATAHLYFTNPIKKFEARASSMFSTHPPIVDRINRLRQLTGDPPLAEADVRALAGLD